MFTFDRSSRSVVAQCVQCGCRDVFTHQAAADAWATDHVRRAHTGLSLAEEKRIMGALWKRAQRRNTP